MVQGCDQYAVQTAPPSLPGALRLVPPSLTIHSPSSGTSLMVYSQPPGASRWAYSVSSCVLMMRRRWLAALKWGS